MNIEMINNKRKVVLFADVLEEDFDGVSITLNKILASIPKDRLDMIVVTPHPPKKLENYSVPIHVCPFIRLPFQEGYRLGLPQKMKGLKEILDDFKPDVIHFTSPSYMGRYAINYARQNDIPVMTIYHTHYPTYIRYYLGKVGAWMIGGVINSFMAWYYKNADLTLVPTIPVRKDLMKLGINKDKMSIWGRAINADRFNPSHLNKGVLNGLVPEGNKTVLFVGRLIKEKETDMLRKLYVLFQRKHEDITMVVTGDGPELSGLKSKMPNAVFTGKKRGEELSQIYASCDVFFFPSASETFGNVVLEAMASGTPVVAANAGGPSDIVKNGVTGFLSTPRNAQRFYKRILTILKDDHLREQMGENAYRYANAKTIDNLHSELWQHYERVIRGYALTHNKPFEEIGSTELINTPKHSMNEIIPVD